jgi:hypothetical protein
LFDLLHAANAQTCDDYYIVSLICSRTRDTVLSDKALFLTGLLDPMVSTPELLTETLNAKVLFSSMATAMSGDSLSKYAFNDI